MASTRALSHAGTLTTATKTYEPERFLYEDQLQGLQVQAWEHNLLDLAYSAYHPVTPRTPVPVNDAALLTRAYARCDEVIREHGHTFYLATALLPAEKRRAMRALYAFCRVTDDTVDCSPAAGAEAALAAWRRRAASAHPPSTDLVATAWADTRLSYRIPYGYAEQLVEGVSRDLKRSRYSTFGELAEYAYGVASTVGLMCMHIIGRAPGVSEQEAIPYAVKLGVALQMTNILRDIGEDRRSGRVYLPTEEMQAYGLSDADLEDLDERHEHRLGTDNRWRAFMRFQIERNRSLYKQAWPGIGLLGKESRFGIAAAALLYRAILDDIEENDYDVFTRRAYVSTARKLCMLPGIRVRSRELRPPHRDARHAQKTRLRSLS